MEVLVVCQAHSTATWLIPPDGNIQRQAALGWNEALLLLTHWLP